MQILFLSTVPFIWNIMTGSSCSSESNQLIEQLAPQSGLPLHRAASMKYYGDCSLKWSLYHHLSAARAVPRSPAPLLGWSCHNSISRIMLLIAPQEQVLNLPRATEGIILIHSDSQQHHSDIYVSLYMYDMYFLNVIRSLFVCDISELPRAARD